MTERWHVYRMINRNVYWYCRHTDTSESGWWNPARSLAEKFDEVELVAVMMELEEFDLPGLTAIPTGKSVGIQPAVR